MGVNVKCENWHSDPPPGGLKARQAQQTPRGGPKHSSLCNRKRLRYLNGDVLMNLKVIEGLQRFPVSKTINSRTV